MAAMKFLKINARAAWTSFKSWVEDPIDPRPMALFRMWFGFLTLINLGLLWPDMSMWLGNDGVIPPNLHRSLSPNMPFQIYLITGYSDSAIWLIKIFGVFGGFGLTMGVFPRASAFCVWLAASSYAWRNSGILHSGDNLIRIGAFFLMFARSDAAFSIKSFFSKKIGVAKISESTKHISAWPQRILQIQLCIVYLVTSIYKFKGTPWLDGTAVGTVLQLGEFERFPIPDFVLTQLGSAAATYFTLGFELLFPFLVWIPVLRLPVLGVGLCLHGGLEWVLNVQMFQWIITSYYLLFIKFDNKLINSDT